MIARSRGSAACWDVAPATLPHVEVSRASDPSRWSATLVLGAERIALEPAVDPLAHARERLSRAAELAPRVVAIIGGGLGYLVQAARERWPQAHLLVLEILPDLARAARERVPALFESGRGVQMFTAPDYHGAEDLWRLFDSAEDVEPAVVVDPVLARVLPEETAHAEAIVRRAVRAGRMNAQARREHAGRYLLNTLRNLPWIVMGGDPSRLAARFSRVPAVVVAAGPSLDENLAGLRDLAERSLVIAVDTAWRPLVHAGIEPQLVVAIDPTELNGRHLTGVPARRHPWVLAEASVHPPALEALDGRVAAIRIARHHPWPWLEQVGLGRAEVRAWGSVLTAAFDLALTLGCDPIVFAGADLAYTGGRPYCRGTRFERDWAAWVARGSSLTQVWTNILSSRRTVTVPDLRGRETVSSPHLIEFRDWLVQRSMEHPDRRIVNASGRGILAGGRLVQTDLRDLTLPAVSGIDLRKELDEVLKPCGAADSLRETLETLLKDSWAPPPGVVKEWLAFAGANVQTEEIRESLESALSAIDSWPPSRTTPRSGGDGRPHTALPTADRVAHLRARLSGDPSVLEGASLAAPATSSRTEEARSILDALLARDVLVTAPGGYGASSDLAATPPSMAFAWTPEAEDLVVRFEDTLLATGRSHSPGYWSAPVDVVLDGNDAGGTAEMPDADLAARLSLATHWLVCGAPPEAWERSRRLFRAALAGLNDSRLRVRNGTGGSIQVHGLGGGTRVLPLRVDALMRALTGAVLIGDREQIHQQPDAAAFSITSGAPGGGPSRDARLAFLRPACPHVTPVILTDAGVPRSWSCATLDDRSVLLTPGGGRQSLKVTDAGHVAPDAEWPMPVSGAVPWGSHGGTLAWSRRESSLLLRRHAGDPPSIFKVPFHPLRPAVAPDGRTFWCAVDGGLWEWCPGGAATLVANTPPCLSLRLEDDGVVLAPVERVDGRDRRRRSPFVWRYGFGDRRLRPTPAGEDGQCSSVAVRQGATAFVHPFGDVIRVVGTSVSLKLACYFPVEAAWVGSGLIVTTGEGDVLLFPDLTVLLEHGRASSPRS